MKLAFVVQRYGLDIAGGAEYHCRLVAERLARQHQVEVLTTCARDYITWADHYPAGTETLDGVAVRRFPVDRPRDPYRFRDASALVFPPGAGAAAELAWLEEEGPLSTALVREVERRRKDYDFFVFFSYRYYSTYHGLRAVPEKALLVPTAEDDGVYRLSIFPPLFRAPRGLLYNSPEERDMIQRVSGNHAVPSRVVGVGLALPHDLDPEAFREHHGLDGPYAIYVGRIDANKGCAELFSHFQRYRQETGSSLRLVLVGQPVLPVPADPGIVHLGFLSEAEKWNAVAGSELLLMPSRYESLSMVTLEAWWARRPVLANARADVLRGQCRRARAGLYYATYDEFRESLALLERTPGLRAALGASGRRYVDTHYTWDVVEGKYLDLMAEVREEDRRRRAS